MTDQCANDGRELCQATAAQSQMIVFGMILFLVSLAGTAQSQSGAQLLPADLVKAVIHRELSGSDVVAIRWKYLLMLWRRPLGFDLPKPHCFRCRT